MESKKSEVYTGKYKGIPYEIRKWNSGGRTQWNYYLFLVEDQIPNDFDAIWLKGERLTLGGKESRHIFYRYEDTWISNLEWHGGCTYYEKISGFDNAKRAVKVGCDYAHFWDEGHTYSISDIEQDVIECIDSMVRNIKVLQWCAYCGEYSESVSERNYCQKCEALPPARKV